MMTIFLRRKPWSSRNRKKKNFLGHSFQFADLFLEAETYFPIWVDQKLPEKTKMVKISEKLRFGSWKNLIYEVCRQGTA